MSDNTDRSAFYRRVLHTLAAHDVPFVVGGAFAFTHYCGLKRQTKDLDLFIREADWPLVAATLGDAGVDTHLRFPHWLGKATAGGHLVDLIFNSGNGVSRVDDEWVQRGPGVRLLDVTVRVCPVEEMIWSKAYVMERERFDGADVLHLLRATGRTLDWAHLLRRFGGHWRVLLSHLVLFGFVYPGQAGVVPDWVLEDLLGRLREEDAGTAQRALCRGTLLSRAQYAVDVEEWGYLDARLPPFGRLSPEQMRNWISEIDPTHKPAPAVD